MSLEAPVLVRRPRLPGMPAGWHTKITVYAWKIPRQFAPKGHEGRAFLVVHVYNSEDAMFAAFRRLAKHWARNYGDRDFKGAVVSTPRRRRGGLSTRKPFAEIFLWRGLLSAEVIAHESLHAATAYLRGLQWARGKGPDLSLGHTAGIPREERLAYLAGHFAGAIQHELIEHRVWNGRP